MSMLDAALGYARLGWHVFPCMPLSKLPATDNGFYAATTNPETIKRYWRQSDRNVAIRTGVASGIWVFDVDAHKDGEASLRRLEAEHGPLPKTREAISVRGGRHCYFKYSGPIPCSADKIGPGLDAKPDGGYIIAPPSRWRNGRAYTWSVDSIDELAIAPDWLVELARKKPAPSISERALANMRRPAGASPNPYGAAALEDEIAALASTPNGSRNHALNSAAFSLFQLVAGGELDESEVIGRLVQAAHANGLMTDPDDGPAKVWKTIQSGRRAGLQSPRSRPAAA